MSEHRCQACGCPIGTNEAAAMRVLGTWGDVYCLTCTTIAEGVKEQVHEQFKFLVGASRWLLEFGRTAGPSELGGAIDNLELGLKHAGLCPPPDKVEGYTIYIEPNDREGGWKGTAPAFPDVVVYCDTKQEATEEITAVIKGLVGLAKEMGHPLPSDAEQSGSAGTGPASAPVDDGGLATKVRDTRDPMPLKSSTGPGALKECEHKWRKMPGYPVFYECAKRCGAIREVADFWKHIGFNRSDQRPIFAWHPEWTEAELWSIDDVDLQEGILVWCGPIEFSYTRSGTIIEPPPVPK